MQTNRRAAASRFHRPWRGLAALLAATTLSTLAGSAVAAADAAAATAASDDAAGAQVGEVVVTARHRSEDAQKVPIALSVVGGDFLNKTNTTNIGQVSQLVPSVQFSFFNARNTNINIRGVGNNIGLANDGIEPGVGFYVDQVYYDRPATATFDLVDIDRVEVLRGPQGTLFGKNTTAGAIAITTESPTFQPQAMAEVTGGNYGYLQTKASVSGPIVGDELAGRLSLITTTREGFLTNTYDGNDHKVNADRSIGIRGQLLYTPNSEFKLRLIGDYSRQNTNCCDEVLVGSVLPPNGKNFIAYSEAFGFTPVFNPYARQTDTNSPIYARQETGGATAIADWDLGKVVVSSISSWRFWNWWPANDSDYTPLSVLTLAQSTDFQRQFSQEFRIASEGVNKVDYVGGLYLFHETIHQKVLQQYGDAASYFLLNPALPAVIANGYTLSDDAHYITTSLAAFGQATWHVTSRLNLTGGLRYTHDDKDGDFIQVASGGVPLTGALAGLTPFRNALGTPDVFAVSNSVGNVSGMANVSYQVTDGILAYVNYARGFKSGGLNLTQLPPGATSIVAPETVDAIEGGIKSRLFDHRVTLNADVFWERDDDYQANVVNVALGKQYLSNVPEVRSEGVEADIQAQPFSNLSLYGSVTWDDAIYASYADGVCGLEDITSPHCNLSGAALAGVPRWAAAAGGEYSHSLSLGAKEAQAYFGVDYSFRSSIFSAATDSIYSKLPSLSLVNARLGLRAANARWDVYVWAKNLLNENYLTFIAPGVGNTGELAGQVGDPRTYGVTLRVRY